MYLHQSGERLARVLMPLQFVEELHIDAQVIERRTSPGECLRVQPVMLLVASCFLWAGMILGISFLETPVKFTAPSVTLADWA
jgi:hypothetical protein